MRRAVILLLAAGLALDGCGRDFEAPGPQVELQSFVPAGGFSGIPVALCARNLPPQTARIVVTFDLVPAEATLEPPADWDPATAVDCAEPLYVRVPVLPPAAEREGARIALDTGSSQDVAEARFDYRGPGHPVLGRIQKELHLRAGLAAVFTPPGLPVPAYGAVSQQARSVSLFEPSAGLHLDFGQCELPLSAAAAITRVELGQEADAEFSLYAVGMRLDSGDGTQEVELGMSGLVDEGSAVKAGKVRGIEIMVFGVSAATGVSARAVHAETGRVIASAKVASAGEVRVLGERLAFDIETYLARENVRRLRNDSPSIATEFWVERKGGGRLVPGKANTLKIGNSVVFRFRSNRDGYLTIVDIQPGGDVVVLYPNEFSKDNRVVAGTLYSVPSESDTFEVSVSEPAGTDTVVAFFTQRKAEWLDRSKLEGEGFWTVKGPERFAAARGLSITATGLKKDEWESAVIEIEVGR